MIGASFAGWAHALASAAQFLTRLRLPGGASTDPSRFAEDLPLALVLLPLVGGMIGGVTALVFWLATQLWPAPLAVLLALAAEALLTGALHEDAVADFCDAFGGGRTSEDVLRILKDSRIGSYGLVGLGLALALRAGGLMAARHIVAALVVSGALSRLMMLFAMAAVPAVPGRPGLGSYVAAGAGWRVAGVGTVLCLPVFCALTLLQPRVLLLGVPGSFLFLAWFRAVTMQRIGGVTGDCVGFAGYAGMLIVTLGFATLPA